MQIQELEEASDLWYFYIFSLDNTRPSIEIKEQQKSKSEIKDRLIEHILNLDYSNTLYNDNFGVQHFEKLLHTMQEHGLLSKDFKYNGEDDGISINIDCQDYYFEVDRSIYIITCHPKFILDKLPIFLY